MQRRPTLAESALRTGQWRHWLNGSGSHDTQIQMHGCSAWTQIYRCLWTRAQFRTPKLMSKTHEHVHIYRHRTKVREWERAWGTHRNLSVTKMASSSQKLWWNASSVHNTLAFLTVHYGTIIRCKRSYFISAGSLTSNCSAKHSK